MTTTVMKQIEFCAGHRLVGHGGKCASLHGHNYRLQVFVSAEELDELGRVIDFAQVRDLFKGWIDQHWDHGVILAAADENGIQAVRQSQPHKLFLLPDPPTAENLARYLMDEVASQLLGIAELSRRNIRVSKIILWESATSSAEVVAMGGGESPADQVRLSQSSRNCDETNRAAWVGTSD